MTRGAMLQIFQCGPPWKLVCTRPVESGNKEAAPEWCCVAFSPAMSEVDHPGGQAGQDWHRCWSYVEKVARGLGATLNLIGKNHSGKTWNISGLVWGQSFGSLQQLPHFAHGLLWWLESGECQLFLRFHHWVVHDPFDLLVRGVKNHRWLREWLQDHNKFLDPPNSKIHTLVQGVIVSDLCHTYTLDLPPTQSASGKWRFRLGFLNLEMYQPWWWLASWVSTIYSTIYNFSFVSRKSTCPDSTIVLTRMFRNGHVLWCRHHGLQAFPIPEMDIGALDWCFLFRHQDGVMG